MAEKPRITAINKVDAMDADTRAARIGDLQDAVGGDISEMSGVSREGLDAVLRLLRGHIEQNRRAAREDVEEVVPWRP